MVGARPECSFIHVSQNQAATMKLLPVLLTLAFCVAQIDAGTVDALDSTSQSISSLTCANTLITPAPQPAHHDLRRQAPNAANKTCGYANNNPSEHCI